MRPLPTAGLGLLSALIAVACSSGGDASPTVTTEPAASTSAEPSTSSTSTSTPSSTNTSTTTTTAPPTTVDPIESAKQAVATAAVQSREDYLYAVRNYDAPDALDVLARTTLRDSPAWNLGIENIETLRSNGWRTREHPSISSNLTVEGEVELLDGPPATRAQVVSCAISAGIIFEPGGAPDGSDTIVNDEIVARRARSTFVLDEGVWKLTGGESLGEWNGASECPAV